MSEDEKLLKEAKKLPWDERLAHKNWKVRNDANIDLTAVCDGIADPKDPKLREFGPLFRKALVDSNAPVQEKALDAVMAFLRASDTDAARYAKEICDSIIAKCLTGRPKTIEKAQAVFLLWVELEAAETFLDAMEKAIKNKVAKAVVPAIDVMFQAVSEFGTKIVPPKRILKMLPELFDHQDQSVRASAKGLTIELCRWIGKDVIKSILFEKMRDTMKKELEAELVNVTGVPKPTRKIRSEQTKEFEEEAVEVSGNKHDEEATSECVPETDEYDLVDPIDILTPLEKSGFWDGVKATKWSERRDGVAELTKLASARRIAPGDFTEVSRTLKKLITDVNIAVAVEAVQGAGNLANGLRKDFSSGSRILLPVLLEKLKEKKQVMVEALTQTLQAMHKGGCLSLVDVIEEVKAATKNKVPTVRSLTLNWVTFCIETSPKAVVLKLHKDYVPILMESLNDGTPDVRDAAFSALAAIAKLVGMRPLERSLEKLDDVRRKKLTDMIGTEGSNNSSNPPAASGRAVGGAGVMTAEASQGAGQKRSAASMLSGKKPVAPDTQKAKSNAPGKQSTTKKGEASGKTPKNETPEDIEPGEMSLEDIEAKVSSFLDASVLGNLKSSVWKERLEAMVTLKEMVESLPDIEQCTELIVRLLSTLPGWNEKNVQVQQKVVEVITNLTERSTKFSKRCVVLCIVGVAERMADIKTRAQAMKCLTGFCEAVGPSFVFERLFKVMKEHKNPKVFSECLLWMVAAVDDFGISHLKLKDIIDFCKDVGLQSSVPATRNATIKLLGILHKFVGPDIKGFLTDVKPALQSALDAEYEKNPYEGPVSAPKRTIRAAECADGGGGSGADGLPREDISSKLTPALLKNLASPDWKVRQESIEVINKIIEESNKRIQPTGTGEMFLALKARLSDSNRNLVVITLATLGNLAQAMGPAVEKSSKGILADILKCLGDNKKQTREAAVKTLDSWVAVFELDKMVPYIVPALLDPKICPDGRKDLYDWMTKQINKLNEQPELTQFIKPAAASLQDKSADVRKAAEACLVDLIRACGSEQATRAIRDLQGPSLAAALPILERQRPLGQEFSDSMNLSLNKPIVTKAGAGRNTKVASNGTSDRPPSRSGPSSRSAVSKIAQGKGSKQAAAATVRDAALQGLALFNLKDSNKDERERFISRKFKFEEARPEQVQEIEADLLKYFREDVHRRLLSPDFKKQVEGIEILQKALPMHVKEIIEVIDVLLRWSALRFCESNTTLLLKVLEFFPELVEALKNEGYTLSEFEANIFLPCLVEKSGHNIEKVREKIRELTKLMCFIYPASKAFIFIVEGLRSKNNRTKIECADQIGFMIDRYGIEIAAGPIKALQAVAALTSERDGELRKSALQTLAVAYKILGDDIWRYVGKLSDAQKSMLDDKFKWKAREMDKRKEGRPGEARSALRRSIRDNGPEVAEQSGELGYRPVTVPNAFPSGVHGQYEEQPFHGGSHLSNGPSDWSEALHIIDYSTTPEQDVEAMKLICHELSQSAADTDNTGLDAVLKDSNRLVCGLTKRVSSTFKLGLAGASSRSCKYVLNTLMQTFQLKKLAHAVKDDTSNKLITELLLWLLDERVPLMDDGSQLLKALNVLMLKILENAERTSAFVVLIQLLRPLDPSRWPSPTSEEMVLIRGQKFSDLVVKCLIKLTKVLGSTIYEVDLDRLLHSIHEYLQELGLEEIRRRAGADDKPLRMVKTVLHELVKLRGTAVKGHLSMVPLDSEPPPIILAYIDLNLQTLAAARMLTPATATSHSHWTESTSNGGATAGGGGGGGSSVAPHSSETQLKQELAAIFKKIGDKQTCTIGLYELYRITQLYPQVDIFSQLQNASEAFRTYIRDGLAQMAKNAASGRTPGSASVATPPPVSLPTHDLPKIAPLSPNRGDTNGLPSANRYAENPDSIDISNGGVRMGRTRSPSRQYDVPHVPSGTLDSIRERMKSIQVAGGTMNPHSNGSSVPNLMARNVVLQSIDSSNMEALSQMAHNNPPLEDKALSGLQARMERLKSGALENLS